MTQTWAMIQLDLLRLLRHRVLAGALSLSLLFSLFFLGLGWSGDWGSKGACVVLCIALAALVSGVAGWMPRHEQRHGLVAPMRTANLHPRAYVDSKLVSVSILAWLCALLSGGVQGVTLPKDPFLLILGIQSLFSLLLLSSLCVMTTLRQRRLLCWGLVAFIWSVVALLPGLCALGLSPHRTVATLLPWGPMQLIQGAWVGISTKALLLSFGWTAMVLGFLYFLSQRCLARWMARG